VYIDVPVIGVHWTASDFSRSEGEVGGASDRVQQSAGCTWSSETTSCGV